LADYIGFFQVANVVHGDVHENGIHPEIILMLQMQIFQRSLSKFKFQLSVLLFHQFLLKITSKICEKPSENRPI